MTTRAVTAMALAFLVPGAGHYYLGRHRRAIAFFGIVVFLFVLGISIDGSLYTFGTSRGEKIQQLATLGSMGSGLLYWIGVRFAPEGDIGSSMFEYGHTFALTAGLMNLLLVLDCYDIARGRKP